MRLSFAATFYIQVMFQVVLQSPDRPPSDFTTVLGRGSQLLWVISSFKFITLILRPSQTRVSYWETLRDSDHRSSYRQVHSWSQRIPRCFIRRSQELELSTERASRELLHLHRYGAQGLCCWWLFCQVQKGGNVWRPIWGFGVRWSREYGSWDLAGDGGRFWAGVECASKVLILEFAVDFVIVFRLYFYFYIMNILWAELLHSAFSNTHSSIAGYPVNFKWKEHECVR